MKTAISTLAARNRETLRLFEKCINTNDLELGRKLIAETAAFKTPVSPTPLYGAEGYLSVVSLMRKSFPDVQWKLVDMVADEKTVAVQWECSGTFNGEAPFAGLQPNGRSFTTTVMNFWLSPYGSIASLYFWMVASGEIPDLTDPACGIRK